MLWKIKDEAHFNLSPTDGVMYYWLFDVNEVSPSIFYSKGLD